MAVVSKTAWSDNRVHRRRPVDQRATVVHGELPVQAGRDSHAGGVAVPPHGAGLPPFPAGRLAGGDSGMRAGVLVVGGDARLLAFAGRLLTAAEGR